MLQLHLSRAAVVVLGPEFMSIDLRIACEGRELASLSWCGRKSLGQFSLRDSV